MKRGTTLKAIGYLIVLSLLLTGCQQFSETEIDSSAGLNGGFEISKNKLPVNWAMYTPNTVPDANFKIELDKENFVEGKQSLKFEVTKCKDIGGWLSPGFTNQFHEIGSFKGKGTYKVSFWIMNKESKFRISAGGVSPKLGEMNTLLEGDSNITEWQLQEFNIDIPKDMELRLELNILKSGTFWIDNIQVEKL